MNFCRDLHGSYCSHGYLAPTGEVLSVPCRMPSTFSLTAEGLQLFLPGLFPVTAEVRLHRVVLLDPFAGLSSQ